MIASAAEPPRHDWTRRYPPLLAVIAALGLAIYALPSALNLPQANPGQVAEYAPVPGNSGAAPPGGNFAGLGLGTSGGLAPGGVPTPPPTPPPLTQPGQSGQSGSPGEEKGDCVGNPPRQTSDPLSPPCVPYFKGDNGGNTWVGVTRNEIVVLFRFWELQGGTCRQGTTASNNCGAPTGYYDMNNTSDVSQNFYFRYLRDWQTYFNAKYQTYGRFVHFWAYNYGDTATVAANPPTSENARHDAVDNWNHTHPFAALDHSDIFTDDYSKAMADHSVMEFQLTAQFAGEDYQQYPGLFWSYPPPLDRVAEAYATYVCTKIVAPGKVSFAGSSFPAGTPRKYGLLYTTDSKNPDMVNLDKAAAADIKRDCGIDPVDKAAFRYSGGDDSGPASGWGVPNMTKFMQDGVTTILWPGGTEYEDQRAASNLHYYPEWVMAGDEEDDGNLAAIGWPTDESSHFVVVTPQTRQNADGHGVEQPCADALAQTDPTLDKQSLDYGYACEFYAPIRQLFTGIQLSGPHLTAPNMDQGFHAIPPKPSTSPDEPACFYQSNDYSCVKDDVAEFFDPNAQTVTANPTADQTTSKGCWRMWQNGFRYLPGQWPSGDARQGYAGNEVCNLYGGGYLTIQRTDSG